MLPLLIEHLLNKCISSVMSLTMWRIMKVHMAEINWSVFII